VQNGSGRGTKTRRICVNNFVHHAPVHLHTARYSSRFHAYESLPRGRHYCGRHLHVGRPPGDGFLRQELTAMFPASESTAPDTVKLTVPQPRSRRYLTEKEIERLMGTARKHSRRGHRDATMILVAYRHGLRASELCDLQWHQIELAEGRLHVHR